MALKATIFKAELQLADVDRGYYRDHSLVLARHPSETDERMMVRLLAFALNAGEFLEFGRGLGADREPDLWQKDLTGAIRLWVEVGLPEAREVRKACGRSEQVRIYSYGGSRARLWWEQVRADLANTSNLSVVEVPPASTEALARLAQRTMRLQCTIQEGQVWLTDGQDSAHVEPVTIR
jgi:uncharacterized protein YaeQ